MASSAAHIPRWLDSPPSPFDIVTCYFPEQDPAPGASPKLRPALVINVYRGKSSGAFACDVVFGSTHLKLTTRLGDLVIQNAADLAVIGLPRATRFDLDRPLRLPWSTEFFDTWRGYKTPRIGALTLEYQKDYAFLMMMRLRSEDD